MSDDGRFYRLVSPGVGPDGRLFVEISYGPSQPIVSERMRLSITGVEGPKANGDARGSCGQCIDALDRLDLVKSDTWDAATLYQLRKVWEDWHLNDMRAGTPAQEAALKAATFPGYPTSHYEWAKAYLAAQGLDPDPAVERATPPGATPTLLDSLPGYRYGSAWLYEEVPAEVLDWLRSLPETTHTYPWGRWSA